MSTIDDEIYDDNDDNNCYSEDEIDHNHDDDTSSFVIVSNAKHVPTSCAKPVTGVNKSVTGQNKSVTGQSCMKPMPPHLQFTTPAKSGVLIRGLRLYNNLRLYDYFCWLKKKPSFILMIHIYSYCTYYVN